MENQNERTGILEIFDRLTKAANVSIDMEIEENFNIEITKNQFKLILIEVEKIRVEEIVRAYQQMAANAEKNAKAWKSIIALYNIK